ncbi:MAG: hypothetical protein E7612_07110 [Ruminococcaceae bacterium]|nr:hypothetical protein [Oscillospiraceae bacterium]
MVFENAVFIKPDIPFCSEFKTENTAPMFRKKFNLKEFKTARLCICGLGYAYCYLNGKRMSEDLFCAPVSNYNKTLWYNEYDVSHLLKEGENTVAVICGNGFYNETIPTNWKFHEASWRDNPKFIFELKTDGKTVLVSDGTWKCNPRSPIYFNQLRMGEYYDANIIGEDWINPEYSDADWGYATEDNAAPSGVFRRCECEPIREDKVYKPKKSVKINDNTCVYDFGQNISGYVRLKVKGRKGDVISLRYSECVGEDNLPAYYGMDKYYLESGFQTDKVTSSGEPIEWSPRFAYHGFRYIEASGTDYCDNLDISAVFVHQDVKRRTEFECSDEYVNRLFQAGVMSSYSNMFYMLTDCPTREKFGWTNDAQSSCEQMLTNFQTEKLLEKWHRDIKDAMRENGELPGIIPTAGWGYHWGNGPVSDGILFEIPYRIYLHTANAEPLKNSLEYFDRYLNYLETRKNEKGFVDFGLDDWAAPGQAKLVEVEFINAVLMYSFYKTTALAAKLCDSGREEEYLKQAEDLKLAVKERYIDREGLCRINEQCSVAMLIYYGIYDDLAPLKNQLEKLMKQNNYHLKCGMVGMRRLLHALTRCGLSEYALKLLKAEGYPGYKEWMDRDATTLWEKWDINTNSDSKNHHMYSDFMSWLVKTLGGIKPDEERCGELELLFEPIFIDGINYVKLNYEAACGKISVAWKRENGVISLRLEKDENLKIKYNGEYVKEKINEWSITL